MRYLGEDMDGNLYEYVEGLDGWGNPIGYWQGISQPEPPSLSGLGELYEAPDGTVYQVQGLAEEEETPESEEAAEPEEEESGESEAPTGMGPRQRLRRRVRVLGPRQRLRRRARVRRIFPARSPRRADPGVKHRPVRKRRGFLKKLLPIAKFASRLIPVPGAGAAVRGGLTVADKLLTRKGVAGYDGLGALYAAPDGTVYQVQGPAEEDLNGLYGDEELRGFAEDEELQGLYEDEELRGFAEDEELQGLYEDEELRGFAEDEELQGLYEDEELRGFAEDEELQGIDGYVQQDGVSGLEAYVPQESPQTHWHVPPAEPPEIWKPIW